VENVPVRIIVREVCVKRGNIELTSEETGTRIRLREFQEKLVQSFCNDTDRFIGLEAPTAAGKTFTLLAPLIANVLCGSRYQGAVGIYPTKPLVNDQFLSLRNVLDSLGERLETIKGTDGFEFAVKYRLKLEITHNQSRKNMEETVGLVRLTREALNRIEEYLNQQEGTKGSLLDIIRRALIDSSYLIVVAVPEYPYMILSSMYRSVADSYKLLDLALDGDFIYKTAKEIASASSREELDKIVQGLKKFLKEAFSPKRYERERLNIYSALFSEVLFLDEFHVWTMYERPTVIALVLLHYLESLRSPEPNRYRVVFSSATPQSDVYDIIRQLNIGEVKVVKAELDPYCQDSDKVKSRAVVEFVPVPTKPIAGVVAWFKAEDFIPGIVERYKDAMLSSGRAIVFARRNAVVEEAAESFSRHTGKTPAVVTGVKTRFPGKELLEERKSSGELFVFGNYSIELGVDLKNLYFGVPYGVSVGEVIQRLGRIGRGDVNEAHAVIPVPRGYIDLLKKRVDEMGGVVDYVAFTNILSEVMPQRLSIEEFGTGFIMGHKLGKLRIYAPLATYVLTQIYVWEYHELLQELCRAFVNIVNSLGLVDIFGWLRKVQKTPEVLIPLASFRISCTVPYVRVLEKSSEGSEIVEDAASLSTLLGNYSVEYVDGRVVVKGVSKNSLLKVLSLHCSYSPRGVHDIVITSDFLLGLMGKAVNGDSVLLKLLREKPIPLYIAPLDVDAEMFVAYGYALKFELPSGKSFYAFML